MGVITCRDVTKRFRSFEAVNISELIVKENAITGLIGRNSAGKTTLLQMIAGFLRANSGELRVFGEVSFNNLTVSTNSIFVDDKMAFPDNFALEDILQEMANFYPNWDAVLAERLFEHFELDKRSYHQHLSKGRMNTFNMIVGLASHSPLTIFDEPTTGMDASVRQDFYRALLKDYIAHPRTILISSHHLNEIEDLLEEIILIDKGQLKLHVTMDELREYAVRVTGPEFEVKAWSRNRDVIFKERFGLSDLHVVVRGDVTDAEVEQLGFKKSAVSPTDIAVYITHTKKGGIDDVFRD